MTEETEEFKAVEVPAKFKSLVESIEKLSVLELSELVRILEDKFGVSAAPTYAAGVVGTPTLEGGVGAATEEEKSSFNVVLAQVGEKKIEVIKAVRDATGKGLKEAKDVVDQAVASPQAIKEGVGKEEAEDLKKKLEAAGATVELT